MSGAFQAAGGASLSALRGALGGDGGFKRGDVGVEMGDEIGGKAGADERGLKCDGPPAAAGTPGTIPEPPAFIPGTPPVTL